MDNIVNILAKRDIQIPNSLFFLYKDVGLTDQELLIIIYLMNNNDNIYNPKQLSDDMRIDITKVLELINDLSERGLLKIDIVKLNNIRNEVINLDPLYEKLALLLMGKQDKEVPTTIYDTFEQELGRTLSPMEYEIINGWINSDYSQELIILALKEAIYNGVSNFRYIDRIIFEWHKKNIKTKEDVERNRRNFKTPKKQSKELFDYDWLNDHEDN